MSPLGVFGAEPDRLGVRQAPALEVPVAPALLVAQPFMDASIVASKHDRESAASVVPAGDEVHGAAA